MAFIAGITIIFKKIKAVLTEFVVPAEENKPSPLALAGDAFAVMLGRAIVAQIKTVLMGLESGRVRGEKAVQGDLALDIAGQSPLAPLLGAMPNLGRTLKRNPGLLDLALPFLAKLAQPKGNGSGPAVAGSSSQPKFKL